MTFIGNDRDPIFGSLHYENVPSENSEQDSSSRPAGCRIVDEVTQLIQKHDAKIQCRSCDGHNAELKADPI